MNTARFVHQQAFQLKWHVLACLGLIMGVPLEEAVVNLHAGEGFHSSSMTMVTLLLGPLLAALIACANVQGDLDEKRDAFWRSKPVSVRIFIAGKFLIGLILALAIVACPILFMWITTHLTGGESLRNVRVFLLAVPLISVLTYSVCFFCNVLVRKTARAWLIGMTTACFVLLIPFVLPLNIVDLATDLVMVRWFLGSILVATLGLAVLSFLGSIIAVQRNWQVHTHLRGLLWSCAGLVFAVFLLFSRQVANIKILDEETLSDRVVMHFGRQGDRFTISSGYEVMTGGNTIDLQPIDYASYRTAVQGMNLKSADYDVDKRLHVRQYPYDSDIYSQIGGQYYAFRMHAHYRSEEVTTHEGKLRRVRHYKHAYLSCSRDISGHRVSVSRLDLSEYIGEDESLNPFALRFGGDKAVVLIDDHCLVMDMSRPEAPAVMEDKPLKRSFFSGRADTGVFPLLPVESLDAEDRIRSSLGLASRYRRREGDVVVNEQSDPISYAVVSHEGIARFEFEKVENEAAIFKRRDERPFTVLETLFGGVDGYGIYDNSNFIQDGKLYCRSGNKLMVFDVGGARVRKLGHFQRVSYKYAIEDVKVVEHGNMLLLSRYDGGQGEDFKRTSILQLLKNPE